MANLNIDPEWVNEPKEVRLVDESAIKYSSTDEVFQQVAHAFVVSRAEGEGMVETPIERLRRFAEGSREAFEAIAQARLEARQKAIQAQNNEILKRIAEQHRKGRSSE